jgi:hypothetical protein
MAVTAVSADGESAISDRPWDERGEQSCFLAARPGGPDTNYFLNAHHCERNML